MKTECIEVELMPVCYVGGRKGKRYAIIYDAYTAPMSKDAPPWIMQYRGCGNYFPTLDMLMGFIAGRGFIEKHQIPKIRAEIVSKAVEAMKEASRATGVSMLPVIGI